MNEVFERVNNRVKEFKADYKQRMDAERAKLAEFEKVLPEAEESAAAAVKANDMKAWKAADKARMDAAAGIKFETARIEALKNDKIMPLDEYGKLKLELDCEYARLRMEFFKLLQNRYKELLTAAEQLDIAERDFEIIMRDLFRIGGDREDGYDRYIPSNTLWGVLLKDGTLFNGIDSINVETAEGRNPNNWVHGHVVAYVNVLNKGRKAGVIK